MNSDLEYIKTRINKVKKIKERILGEIEQEKQYYISTLKESFSCIDYISKKIYLLNILRKYILKDETFEEQSYYDFNENKLIHIISDNTLDKMLSYSFSLVVKWLENFEDNDNIFNLDNFLKDKFFECHFFSTFEKMSSAHFE